MKCEGQKLLLGTALSVVHLLRQAVGTPRLRPRATALPMEALLALGLVLVLVLALGLALVIVLVMVLVMALALALAMVLVLVLVIVMAMLLVMASVAMVAPVVGLGLQLRLGMGQLQRMSRVRRSPPTLLKRTATPHLTAEATPLAISVGHRVKLALMPVTSRLHESLSWSRR